MKEYYNSNEIPYADFRVFRDPVNKFCTKDVVKLSIARLLRINRNLTKYRSADEIIDLLKKLQAKYNSTISLDKHGDQCARTAELVQELFEYIKREKRQDSTKTTNDRGT